MEKSNLCSNWRQHSSRNMKHEFKVKTTSSWDYGNDNWGEGDLVAAGFSWPPRSYICSFCKREFRSAQALGGHMNVHRRDRARLRQSPTRNGNNGGAHFSLLNLNLDPNPSFYSSNPSSNPSSSPSSPPPFSSLLTKFPHFSSKFPSPQNCTADLIKAKALDSSEKGRGCGDFSKVGEESVGLDLEIGLISHTKEELDLELRLGYT